MSAEFDFVVYLGDPDEGAEAVPSKKLADSLDEHKEKLDFPNAYGAIVVREDGEEIAERRADPILPLLSKLARTVPYIIEGESETVLFSESEHGILLEASGDDVFLSIFAGDPYEPDEYLIQQKLMKLKDVGEQILAMAERLRDVAKGARPEIFEDDGEGANFAEFIDIGRDAFKTYKLELERGLRVT